MLSDSCMEHDNTYYKPLNYYEGTVGATGATGVYPRFGPVGPGTVGATGATGVYPRFGPVGPISVLQPDSSYLPEEDWAARQRSLIIPNQPDRHLGLHRMGRKSRHQHKRRGWRRLFPVRASNVGVANLSYVASDPLFFYLSIQNGSEVISIPMGLDSMGK
jgi:hypothetical protein